MEIHKVIENRKVNILTPFPLTGETIKVIQLLVAMRLFPHKELIHV